MDQFGMSPARRSRQYTDDVQMSSPTFSYVILKHIYSEHTYLGMYVAYRLYGRLDYRFNCPYELVGEKHEGFLSSYSFCALIGVVRRRCVYTPYQMGFTGGRER
jgi:hypothetical protein